MGTVSQYSRQKDLLTFVNYDSLEGRDNINKAKFLKIPHLKEN